ncbi:MAG: hypothetical protein FWC83_02525, partial [Alphaproteobacteria bacterium]|nr:hypothetical protein [Alphaproteobacteria bacterium]
FLLFALCAVGASAQTVVTPRTGIPTPMTGVARGAVPSDFITPEAFNNMAPFMNQQMQQRLRPAGTQNAPNQNIAVQRAAIASGNMPNQNLIQGMTQHTHAVPQRQVVQRPGANVARAAGTPQSGVLNHQSAAAAPRQVVARAATGGGQVHAPQRQQTERRAVVARSATPVTQTLSVQQVAPEQCLALYTECMNSYCERPGTSYNRCFCSPRLAEIQEYYRPRIDAIMRQIVIVQNGGQLSEGMSDAELEYWWSRTILTGNNSLLNLNASLNAVDFPTSESMLRGRNAFNIGHEFCIRNLVPCAHAANNMIGVYRNAIARDCTAYQNQMRQLLRAAEIVLLSLGGEL